MESYVKGQPAGNLKVGQYQSFGKLLAQVHNAVQAQTAEIDFWEDFLQGCASFGNESFLFNHLNAELHELIHRARSYCQLQKVKFGPLRKSLVHGDATLSNILVNDDEVSLIDWELSRFVVIKKISCLTQDS